MIKKEREKKRGEFGDIIALTIINFFMGYEMFDSNLSSDKLRKFKIAWFSIYYEELF